ncbi:TRAP transporter substrate-binding protein DctP [Mangrovicoccus sp. HB161399]|uniref:TRAP transporter substrate-binding protein DctP n=1 Tax=Mangrovicoccus sp. HB161399 TaxID=2720392 RepID=UPI001557A90A|nr:TRAP transporter substrate-binding protein DctP [Mangrovicoccus sp. HB161399]
MNLSGTTCRAALRALGGVSLALAAAAVLAAPASAADLRLKFAGTLPVEHQGSKMMEQIAAEIEASDVGLKVTVFPANQLGSGEELFEDTIRGNIDFSMGFIYAHKDPVFEINSMPYLAGDWDEMQSVVRNPDSAFNQIMSEHLEGVGLHLLANNPEGFANVLSTKMPTDWDGLGPKEMNIRVWSSNVVNDTMKALGFNTTTIAWADIFPALQSGIVDGAECCTKQATYTIFAKSGVGKYYFNYNAFMEISTFYASSKTWEKMNDEQRAVVSAAFSHAADDFFEWNKTNDAAFGDELTGAGYEVLTPDPEKAAAMRDHVRATIWPEMAEVVGQDVLDRIQADLK